MLPMNKNAAPQITKPPAPPVPLRTIRKPKVDSDGTNSKQLDRELQGIINRLQQKAAQVLSNNKPK